MKARAHPFPCSLDLSFDMQNVRMNSERHQQTKDHPPRPRFNMRDVRMDGERYTDARTGKRRTYSFNIRNVGIDSESVIKMAEQRSQCRFNMLNRLSVSICEM